MQTVFVSNFDWFAGDFFVQKILGWDGPTEGLLRLKAKSWMDPLDHQDISEHLVTIALETGDTHVIERSPINPIVYLEPPQLWLSGALGNGCHCE